MIDRESERGGRNYGQRDIKKLIVAFFSCFSKVTEMSPLRIDFTQYRVLQQLATITRTYEIYARRSFPALTRVSRSRSIVTFRLLIYFSVSACTSQRTKYFSIITFKVNYFLGLRSFLTHNKVRNNYEDQSSECKQIFK